MRRAQKSAFASRLTDSRVALNARFSEIEILAKFFNLHDFLADLHL
jgi:hypothetical protein